MVLRPTVLCPALLLVAASFALPAAKPRGPIPLRASGTFIALPPPWYECAAEKAADKEKCLAALWDREFENYRALGFDAVVVQTTVFDTDLYFDPPAPICLSGEEIPVPTHFSRLSMRQILASARKNKVVVWVGLRHKEKWNARMSWGQLVRSKEPFVKDSLAVAKALLGKDLKGLEKDRAFAGWYISPEIGTRSADHGSE